MLGWLAMMVGTCAVRASRGEGKGVINPDLLATTASDRSAYTSLMVLPVLPGFKA